MGGGQADSTEEPEEETTLEEDIAELETLIKSVKGVKESPKGKLQLEVWGAELKALREKQKRARPPTSETPRSRGQARQSQGRQGRHRGPRAR